MIDRACVFAHYDKDDRVDDYVYYYLGELLTVVQKLVFVTVSNISKDDIGKLKNLNIEVIKRENIGYDFYSYKIGIEHLSLDLYDELIICNDSAFGPLVPIQNIFDAMQDKECDFWGITDSALVAYHLQSYFIVFNKPILQSFVFTNFWNRVKILNDKDEIIKQYEVGLSRILLKNKFISKSFINKHIPLREHFRSYKINIRHKNYKYLRLIKTLGTFQFIWKKYQKKYNPAVGHWEYLILNQGMPFIKKSLFTTDENKVLHQQKYVKLSKMLTSYPSSLITNYIKRYL
ncbi:MAG: hypothetical protein GQ531_04015 [Sulfurovum sp.]|nr:hypothetical protein [Sulfurovum sp.]